MRARGARRASGVAARASRSGFLFSLDALLAALVLIGGIVLIARIADERTDVSQLSSASEDAVVTLQAVRVYDVSDPWVLQSVANGSIPDANVSALEQVGYFWASGDAGSARRLAKAMLDGQYAGYGVRLTIDGDEVYARNGSGDGADVMVSERMVSGIAKGDAVKGSSASAYLKHIRDKRSFIVATFGGFVGEGNLSLALDGVPADANITDIVIEADTERAFALRINGASCATLQPDPSPLTPSRWSLANCSALVVKGGGNTFSFESSGTVNGSLVSGGYVKVAYTTSQFNTVAQDPAIVYRFPQITGLINLFDGFYVGGNVSAMNLTLRFVSNYTSYLTIGNASWTFAGSQAEQNVTLNDTQLRAGLAAAGMSYAGMQRTTVPLRFGIGNVVVTGTPSDTMMVLDTSGSMQWCTNQTEAECYRACGCSPGCSSGGGRCGSTDCGIYSTCAPGDVTRLSAAKSSTIGFIGSILNDSGTQLGLVEFGDGVKSSDALTTNKTKLTARVNSYSATGGTCICCGVNAAVSLISADAQTIYVTRGTSGWKYNDQKLASPPSGWTNATYSDASWKDGTTPIGWSYADIATAVASGSRYSGDYYYRRKFNATNASGILSARLYVRSDDGADVYLNGHLLDGDYGSVHSALYWNRNVTVSPSYFVSGQNVIAVRQWHKQTGSSSNPMAFDLELVANSANATTQGRTKSVVVMSDGVANDECAAQGTGSATGDAIQAACDAYASRGIKVYAVGFGKDADSATLSSMAACAQGKYYAAANATQLAQVFSAIGDAIIQSSSTQRAIIEGNVTSTTVYSDSALRAAYVPDVNPANPNEISFTLQTDPLANCSSVAQLHRGSRFLDALVTSYSGDEWTSAVSANGATVYNLSAYAPIYQSLGDPYRVVIPTSLLSDGNNSVRVAIGTDALNSSGLCSSNDSVIYTVAINLSTERTDAVPLAKGCTWDVETETGERLNLTIPASYSGAQRCSYTSANITYDPLDAYQLGAWMIFSRLDFNRRGKLFVNIREEDLEIVVTTISGVPYMWGPAIARIEVRR